MARFIIVFNQYYDTYMRRQISPIEFAYRKVSVFNDIQTEGKWQLERFWRVLSHTALFLSLLSRFVSRSGAKVEVSRTMLEGGFHSALRMLRWKQRRYSSLSEGCKITVERRRNRGVINEISYKIDFSMRTEDIIDCLFFRSTFCLI